MSLIVIALSFFLLLVLFVALGWVLLSSFFGLSDRRYASPVNKERRITEPVCGNCGYPSRGLGSLDCPECGADLREAGIITPALVQAIDGGSVGCALPFAWTVGVFLAAILFNDTLAPQLPIQWPQGGWYGLALFVVGFGVWIAGLVFFSMKPKQKSKNS